LKKLNINTASVKELIVLHKVGPTTAKRIIAYRKKNGLFKRKDEIKEVNGISDAIFDGIREDIFASSAGLGKTNAKTKASASAKTRAVAKKSKTVRKAAVKKTTPRRKITSKTTTSPKPKTAAKPKVKMVKPRVSAAIKTKVNTRKAPSTRISKIQKAANSKKAAATKSTASALPKSKVKIPRKTVKPLTKTNELLDNFKKKTVNTIKKYAKDFIKTAKEKPSVKKEKPLSPVATAKPKKSKSKTNEKSPRLKKKQLKELAKSKNIEPSVLKAIMELESEGQGFNKNGTVKIKFHSHVFYQLLKDAGLDAKSLMKGNKKILQKKSSNKYTKGRKSNYKRLKKAMKINKSAALKACSYGLFQLMGNSHKEAGFKSIKAFAKAHKSSEKAQVKAFFKAAKSQNALKDLQDKDWEGFTRKFVTSEFTPKVYAIKLAKAYKKAKKKK